MEKGYAGAEGTAALSSIQMWEGPLRMPRLDVPLGGFCFPGVLHIGALAWRLFAGCEALAADLSVPASVTISGNLQEELGCPGDWQPDCPAAFLAFVIGAHPKLISWQGMGVVAEGNPAGRAQGPMSRRSKPLSGESRGLVRTRLELQVADQANRALRVQGGVNPLDGGKDVGQVPLDVGAGCVGLDEEPGTLQHLDDAGDLRSHGDTAAQGDDL